ncbi:MAG: ribonuclease III [Ignavibacteria bacterium]|nr:ribonuclease III [Ignavibacteria bacterium]
MGWVLKVLQRWGARFFVNKEKAQRSLLHENLRNFEQRIRHSIRNEDVFVQALLHRSFLQRMSHVGPSNERLEFLGDSILNLIVAEYLFHHFPESEEGDLTKLRSRLVNRKALAAYGKELGLFDFILLSDSAAHAGAKGSETIIADTYEAVVAAIYLDGGFEAAQTFVQRQVLAAVKQGTVSTDDENYKSRLLEFSQARGLGTPRYTTVREEGPDHDRTFTVEVFLSNQRQGSGSGKNKKEAEQAAAGEALDHLSSTEAE